MVTKETIDKYEKALNRKLTDKEIVRLGEIEEFYEKARIQFIIIHRVNNYAYDTCIRVFDEMEKRNLIRFKAKFIYKKLEKIWHDYTETMRRNLEYSVYCMLQDNFTLATDAVQPYVGGVINAVRDYLISKGVRDTMFVAEAETSIQMLKICTHSYRQFFVDFKKECGVDFANDFKYANMEEFNALFVQLCEHLHLVSGYDVFQSNRVQQRWNKMMTVIRDEDIMDEAATKALHLNPAIEEKYNEGLKAIEREQMEAKVSELADKFKISKLK